MSGADFNTITNGVSVLFGIPNDPTVVVPQVGQGDGLVRFARGAHPLSVGFFAPGGPDCFGTNTFDNAPTTAVVDRLGSFDRQYWGITGTLEGDWRGLTIINIVDYQSLNKFYIEDTDGTPIQSLDFCQYVDAWQISEEFRIHGDTEKTRWQVGA